MKTKSSRKRLLVSSVAMLLVAMLALGTATYAWFTSSNSVTADGIRVRTSKTSKLEICSNSSGWKADGFTYENVSGIMFPASSSNGTDWYTGTAANSSSYAKAADKNFTKLQKTDNQYETKYVYANMLGIRNTGDQPVSNVKITISNTGNAEYLRYAIVPVTANGVTAPADGGVAAMAEGAFKGHIYSTAARSWNPVVSETAVTAEDNVYSSTATTEISVTTGSEKLNKNDMRFYNVFVWFEGQDTECKDANAGQGITATGGMTFQVTGTPEIETVN